MDFDTAKENIQPLKGGRKADRLETALVADKELLEEERKQYENIINTYTGLDPLDGWYNYVCWIEQSYPKNGHESGLDDAISKCISKFENDVRYRQDRRLIKLLIKFIDTQDNPNEFYEQLYNNGIGTIVSDLYIAWSYYYDAVNDFKKAESIFQKGFNAGAQPYDELAHAHQAFSLSISERFLYDDDMSRKQFQATMEEKRNALTSLRIYNKKFVGSVRVGNAVKNENPGVVPVDGNIDVVNKHRKLDVHKDDGEIAPNQNPTTSGIKSILDLSKKTENVHEAGIWNKASKSSRKNKLFGRTASSQLGFEIMEDEALPPIPCSKNLYEKGCILPPNFVSKNKPQTPWNIPVVFEEPIAPNSISRYDKFMLYPALEIEISHEELRGYHWFKSKNISAPIINQYTSVFENKFEYGARIFPGFVTKTAKQDILKYKLDYDINNNSFIFPIKKMISLDGNTEYSHEELLAEKFKRGEIELVKNDDFEETLLSDNMDLTEIGDRRESVYCPPRVSLVPRKSILRKSVVQSSHEDDKFKQEGIIKSSENRVRFEDPISEKKVNEHQTVLKRKLIIAQEENVNDKDGSASPESKRFSNSLSEEIFKAPDPPKNTFKPVFEIFDDENDETFSTKKFNLFIKSQSVSTPISKKTVPRLVPLGSIETQIPDSQKPENHESTSPPENTMHQNNMHKLSTIAEITETSNSTTKSSVTDNDVDSKAHTKLSSTDIPRKIIEGSQNPMLDIFRIPEEQTETTPFIRSIFLPKFHDIKELTTPMKMPSFRIFEENQSIRNQSVFIPPLDESIPSSQPTNESIIRVTQKNNLNHENSVLEIPELGNTLHNMNKSAKAIPTMLQEISKQRNITHDLISSHIEIPATQDISMSEKDIQEVPPLSDLTIKQFEIACKSVSVKENGNHSKIQETSKSPICNLQNDICEVPNIQNLSLNELEHDEIPATQDILVNANNNNDILEVPFKQTLAMREFKNEESLTTQDISEMPCKGNVNALAIPDVQNLSLREMEHVEIPATQEISFNEIKPQIVPDVKSTVPFLVYEDSVCEIPQIVVKPSVDTCSQSNASRKENLMVPASRGTVSDEFLKLCTNSPKVGCMPPIHNEPRKNEMSDLLKFSDVNSKFSLELLSNSEIQTNKPTKSPSPTLNILEADLNTEKFNLPLKFDKNSTIIGEPLKTCPIPKIGENNESLNLSIAFDEGEFERLEQTKSSKVNLNIDNNVFKVPIMPPLKQTDQFRKENKTEFNIFQDQEDDNLRKSIYRNVQKDLTVLEHGDADTWEDEKMCSFIADGNSYEYTIIQNFDESTSLKLRDAITKSNGNPFSTNIRNAILEHCNFEQYLAEHVESCNLLKNIPRMKSGKILECGNESYMVVKMLGKGNFGTVHEVRKLKTNELFAAKQEKPTNLWEFYILIELQSRLNMKNISHMAPAFMNVYSSIIANNASIFISEYSPYGTIIDVCNKIKASTSKNPDEYIGMIFAAQLLSIIDYLHSCKIIHGDIKPDNFLLMSKIDIGMKVPALQLIDFGSAIDMESFDKDDKFTYVVKTENFTCCEMLENKPWTYQTDFYGLCGTVHVILFGKYMEVEKKLNNWQIRTKFPRYFQKDLWYIFFNTLLNVPDCKTMPNLQNLKRQLDEEIIARQKYILKKVDEFNNALLS